MRCLKTLSAARLLEAILILFSGSCKTDFIVGILKAELIEAEVGGCQIQSAVRGNHNHDGLIEANFCISQLLSSVQVEYTWQKTSLNWRGAGSVGTNELSVHSKMFSPVQPDNVTKLASGKRDQARNSTFQLCLSQNEISAGAPFNRIQL